MAPSITIFAFFLLICCTLQANQFASSMNISTDESALLAFKSHITSDANGILAKNWTKGTAVCSWIGIACSRRHQRVTTLALKSMQLGGTIAKELGNLSFLSYLEIGNNSFHGEIPQELGRLTRLKYLSLQMNNLTGEIPASIGLLTRLELLDLSENDLFGTVPLSIFNVSSLKVIDMNWNDLSGTLPNNICHSLPQLRLLTMGRNQLTGQLPNGFDRCKQLQLLALSYNLFTGSLPKDMWNSTSLQIVLLGWNNFTGNIPSEIENLSAVQLLSLRRTNLAGNIPPSIGNLSNLEMIDLGDNHLNGKIPQELGHALNLKEIYLGPNMLSGEVPSSIFNISGLEMISLVANELSGKLLDHNLPYLEGLYLGVNQFTGPIPSFIANSSKLIQLDLGRNMFNGNIPLNLGNLQQLQFINLQENHLTNDPSTEELSFLISLSNCKYLKTVQFGGNPISGTLPKSLAYGNWSNSVEQFLASDCSISGRILPEFGNFSNLVWLGLENNELNGSIPLELGNLRKLQKLRLDGNNIHDIIPKSLCNMHTLYEIDLSNNKLSGEIPSCLANLSSLRQLYLDSNALTGNIPPILWSNKAISVVSLSNNLFNGSLALEIGNSRSLMGLFLSGNLLTGQIPSTIGQLQNLVQFSLSMNRLHGPIPESFSQLVSLEYLDLSSNNLSGMIPKSLENLEHLTYFNVSFNRLIGEIPQAGPFVNFTAESFMGNTALCGASRYQVMACKLDDSSKKTSKKKMVLIISVLASVFVLVMLLLSIFSIWLMKWRKQSRQLPLANLHIQSLKRISYFEIAQGTNNFDEASLIGKGSLGLVYKGILENEMVVAVKVFNTEVQDAFTRFDLECQVLRNIRHRNLVKVISSVANLDFKALVLEYMSNGNLDTWLYSHNNFLDLIQRMKVMIDVASAMEYLHEGHSFVVVHCDLKPSNILLDGDMVARVSDFGISKLLTPDNLIAHTKTLGTIGYMAPEYGSEGMVSTKGDVYSFGILLMETFTRKNPMDDLFVGDLNLKTWVLQSFPNRLTDVVDANLFSRHEENFTSKENCFKLIMELALECTVDVPEERLNMTDVFLRLKKILAQFLKDTTTTPNRERFPQ